jgi:hypothetical protein
MLAPREEQEQHEVALVLDTRQGVHKEWDHCLHQSRGEV